MWKRIVTVSVVLMLAVATHVSAQTLKVGDAAPAIEVKEFVKGSPVSGLQKGKLYVVEFWATWCGPCRVSIPHLTELQKKYPDITFIGVSVWERDAKGVKPFVQEMGDKMAYTVAMDDVPAGASGNEGKMAKNWMEAAGQHGIPTAFVINRDGKIAWIGHPMRLDEPLPKVVAGTWDERAAAAQFQKDQAEQQKMAELRDKLVKAQQSGDPNQMVAVLDQAIADNPGLETSLGIQKYQLMAKQGKDPAKTAAYGTRLVDTVLKDNPQMLNEFAWLIVAPGQAKPNASSLKLALKAAQRADTLAQGKDAAIADTLAKAYFDNGNAAKALEAQERAVRLAKGTPVENDQGVKDRLEQYRKAVKK
jgi:thiol-disulfide isomerase/thioredoxin